ncbi:glutathione S-transferase Mu 6-like isoform X1 [Grammomys surdaster]|uniref:glutathione S-transferase Mu 6-like isoform X1 n=1 Tax=Grammomys surdaster TaxID=491861 RepID=UPI00109F0370|nr:glutathione S-transferase Mu 6-like isoform X1 [Grammomys surdaster]
MHAGLSSQLGHAICLLLEYTETSYEEKRYAMGDGEVKARVLEGPPRPAEALLRVPGIVAMFAGNKVQRVTFADFFVYDVLDQHQMFEPKCLDAFLNLMDFVACFEVMP